MAIVLESSRAKTARALMHFEALDADIRRAIDEGSGVAGELNQKTGWKEIRFSQDKPLPVEWGLLVGDFAHNLRSALDHAVFTLSGGKRWTQFPIFTRSDDYFAVDDEGRTRRDSMLNGVPDTYRAVIDQCQPFHRVGDKTKDPLAQLAWLNNADKHRLIHASFSVFGEAWDLDVQPSHGAAAITSVETEIVVRPGTFLKHGALLYKIRTSPNPAIKVDVKSQIPLRIGFGKRAPRVETGDLTRLMDYVRDLILRLEQV